MAQIEFFASEQDELRLLNQIFKDDSIELTRISDGLVSDWVDYSNFELPNLDEHLELCLFNEKYGQLKWHENQPKIDQSTHGKLVNSIFSIERWKSRGRKVKRLLNDEESAIIYYKRGSLISGYRTPYLIFAPQSNIENIGSEFKKWFNRLSSWVRRNGELVYNWNKMDERFKNDFSIVNSVYALPEAMELIEKDNHSFAISIDDRK